MIGTRRPRRTALLVTLAAIAVVAGGLLWQRQFRSFVLLGPMVQQVTTTEFAVFVGVSGTDHLTARLYADGDPHGEGVVNPQGGGRFIITFSGLSPASTYEYELRAEDGAVLCRHPVRTAPDGARAFRFAALGDTGVGDRHQFGVAEQMQACRPDFVLHVGDLIYPRGRLEEHPRKFFQPYAELLATVPIYVSLGNHEYRMPEFDPVADAFVFPPNGPAGAPPERNYWLDYGDARFVAIDSNNDEPFFARTIVPWLDETLSSAADRWKILFFHEAVHTNAKYPPAAKLLSTIVPVLESHGTHLVLCGHNHLYERSRPMRGKRICAEGEGTVYVTTGAGGANLADARLPMPEDIVTWEDREHSFTLADVTPGLIRLRQIGETGRLIDEHYVHRRPLATGE